MFDMWTRIKLVPKKMTHLGQYPVNIHPLTIRPSMGQFLLSPDETGLTKATSFGATYTDVIERYEGCEVGVGLIHRDKLQDVDWNAIGSGAVFALDASCFTPERKTGRDSTESIVVLKPGTVNVLVMPLGLHLAMARLGFAGELAHSHSGVDFRFFFLFGKRLRRGLSDIDYFRATLAPRENQDSFTGGNMLYAGNKDAETREFRLIHDGKPLVYGDHCKTCPRRIEWSLDRCAFGQHNCILGSDLRPELLDAPEPNYKAVFGCEPSAPVDVVSRRDFESYMAGHIRHSSDDTVLLNKDVNALRGARRRMKSAVCKVCMLGDKHAYCQRSPDQCKGPYRLGDTGGFLPQIEPWIWHTIALSIEKHLIHPNRLVRWFPQLKGKRAPMYIARPVDQEYARGTKLLAKSTDTLSEPRWVILARTTYPNYQYIVSYDQACELAGCARIDTREELISKYPQFKYVDPRVVLAVNDEPSLSTKRATLYYEWVPEEKELKRIMGGSSRNFRYILATSNRGFYFFEQNVTLPQFRVEENKALKELVIGRCCKDAVEAGRFMNRCSAVGVEAATKELRK